MKATAHITSVQPVQLDPSTKIIRVAFTCDAEAAQELILGVPIGARVDPRIAKVGEHDTFVEAHFRIIQVGPTEVGPWGEPILDRQERGPARVVLIEKLATERLAPHHHPVDPEKTTFFEVPTPPVARWRRISIARFRGVVPG